MTDSLPILLIKGNCKGGELLSHLRSWFDSGACANHVLRSQKLMWVSALTFLMRWFHYWIEVLVTVRSNIYYLFHSLINRESLWTRNKHEHVIFLTPLSAFYEYSRNARRVVRKPARETHAPIERLGSKRNQYGDGLLTYTWVVNWI